MACLFFKILAPRVTLHKLTFRFWAISRCVMPWLSIFNMHHRLDKTLISDWVRSSCNIRQTSSSVFSRRRAPAMALMFCMAVPLLLCYYI